MHPFSWLAMLAAGSSLGVAALAGDDEGRSEAATRRLGLID